MTLGLDKVTLGTGKVALKICKNAMGISKYARNSSTAPRLLVTHQRALSCSKCAGVFQPANNVMEKFDDPHRYRAVCGRGFRHLQIKCKVCKKVQSYYKYDEVSA